MTVTLRDLLVRVHLFRPDLDEALNLTALEEAARDIARETGIATEVQTPVKLACGTTQTTVAPATGSDLVRVIEVRCPQIPINQSIPSTQYLGLWNALTNDDPSGDPIGLATSKLIYQFYLVSVAGATSVDGITTWNVGDVVINFGTKWGRISLEEYVHVAEVSGPAIRNSTSTPQANNGFPTTFSQENGIITFYPVPENDLAIQLKLSVVSNGKEIESQEFPVDCANALVYGALEFAFNLPGQGQNLKLADMYRVRYQKERANIRAVAMLGYGGSPFYKPSNFSGRTYRNGWS